MKLRFLVLPLAAVSLSLSEPCASRREMPTPGPQDKVVSVSVVYPRFEDIPRQVSTSGKFLASDRLTVKAEFEGMIEKVTVGEGDRVHVGDPVCLFRSDLMNAEIEKKQAELKEAEAALENDQRTYQLMGGTLPQPLKSEETEEEAIFLDEDKKEPEPVPDKINEPVVPPTQAPPVVENPDRIDWTSRIRLAEAKIERITKELDRLEKELTKLNVTAPIAGQVEKRHVTEGSVVQKGEPLFEIVGLNPITLSVAVPQEVATYIDKMIKVKASPAGAPELLLDGTVFYISPSIDPVKRTLEIRVHLPNEEGLIKEGQDGKAFVITRKVDKLMVVPKKAVVEAEGKHYLYVVVGNKAEKTEITPGDPLNAEEVGIESNLRVDDPVIVSGQSQLTNGTFVKILEETVPPSSAITTGS